MNESYLASVIVSSYNYSRFLKEAIDSALNQTYRRAEVIVVDDGSTDGSRDVIAGFGSRIRPVLKENGGQASAFNAGFAESRGEVIFFLDSDDVLLPTAVERASEFFYDSRVVKAHWPLSVIDERSRETGKVIGSNLPEGDLREILIREGPDAYGWPPTSGSAWSRSFIERVFPMPEAEYKTCPDLYLAALAPLFGLVKRVPEPQGFWRSHQMNNSWRESFEERMRDGLWRTDRCLSTLSEYCEKIGVIADPENWKRNSWWLQIESATRKIRTLVPPGETFILVNEDEWAAGATIAGRSCLPFPERDGYYAGPPPDDQSALEELERLRRVGANFIVFVWPHLWWLDYYAGLRRRLYANFRCVAEDDRFVAFDLR